MIDELDKLMISKFLIMELNGLMNGEYEGATRYALNKMVQSKHQQNLGKDWNSNFPNLKYFDSCNMVLNGIINKQK